MHRDEREVKKERLCRILLPFDERGSAGSEFASGREIKNAHAIGLDVPLGSAVTDQS